MLFFASQFYYKGLRHCERERRRRRAAEAELSKRFLSHPVIIVLFGISLEMDGLIAMGKQKFPFTIENILTKYPNTNRDRRSCGTSAGLKEKAVSPAGGRTGTVHHACLCCCCYCSHCGDILQADFINDGKTKLSAHYITVPLFLLPNLK